MDVVRVYNDSMQTMGERILLLRRDLHFTQDDVARRVAISRAHLSRIESGQVPHVMTDMLFRLADVLQTSVPYLLGVSDNAITVDDGDEDDHMVAESTITYDAETPDDRRLIESLLAVVRELSRENRLFLLMMAEKLRKR